MVMRAFFLNTGTLESFGFVIFQILNVDLKKKSGFLVPVPRLNRRPFTAALCSIDPAPVKLSALRKQSATLKLET